MQPAPVAIPAVDPKADVAGEPTASRVADRKRRQHARDVLAHVEKARTRKSGKDLSGMTEDELIADLQSCRTGA